MPRTLSNRECFQQSAASCSAPALGAPRRVSLYVLICAALLAACSPKDETVDAAPRDEVRRVVKPTAAQAEFKAAMLNRQARVRGDAVADEAASPAPMAATATADGQGASADAAPQRFLAVRHHLQIESPAADLAGLWGAVKARCEQLDCQVEASALQRETSHSAGRAYLTMRVNPRDFAMLTDALGGKAKVLNHQTSSEDKTGEVIDVEAQIKNRSEYRDSLRELLREKDVKRKLSDLMEIRDTLSQVQAEIDAAQAQRKLLEKETAKQFVQMEFQPQQITVLGTYNPWLQTWENAWRALTHSAQGMVIAAAALLPWAVVLCVMLSVLLLVLRKVWRVRRAQATPEAPVVSVEPNPQAG